MEVGPWVPLPAVLVGRSLASHKSTISVDAISRLITNITLVRARECDTHVEERGGEWTQQENGREVVLD